MNPPDRDNNLWMCPEVRKRILAVQADINTTGAMNVTCERCCMEFDVTANGATPVADFCSYGTSQLTPYSQVDEA